MPKDTKATAPDATPPEATAAAAEPRNIAVEVVVTRTKIGKAICGSGPCDFPLTLSDAKTLEAMGLVRILGIF